MKKRFWSFWTNVANFISAITDSTTDKSDIKYTAIGGTLFFGAIAVFIVTTIIISWGAFF